MKEFAPASAFSEGDLLLTTGVSTVSGQATLMATDTAAVACADSVDSVNGLVPCIVPGASDVFISSLTPAGSLVTFGDEVDVEVDGAGRHYCGISANTAVLVMIDYATDQSTVSQAHVKILYANIDAA
jgi:hypothetical protein